jgi:hypothetical protein
MEENLQKVMSATGESALLVHMLAYVGYLIDASFKRVLS